MKSDTNSNDRSRRTASSRRLGVVVCLVALLLAVFGHVDPASAALAADGYSVMTDDHAATTGDHGGVAAVHHCVHSGHCAFHTLLPAATGLGALRSAAPRRSACQRGKGRAVSPWRRPPSTTEIG